MAKLNQRTEIDNKFKSWERKELKKQAKEVSRMVGKNLLEHGMSIDDVVSRINLSKDEVLDLINKK